MSSKEESTRSSLTKELVSAAQQLFENGVMSHSGHANLSGRLSETEILLSTQGHIRHLSPQELARVDLDGTVLEGDLDPTNAEIVAMHTQVYRLRPEIGGIIHTHSPALLAFAVANKVLPCRYEALLRWGQATPVPVAKWAPRGTEASVGNIVQTLTDHRDSQAVLLGNHGVLVLGSTPLRAVALLTVLEEAAQSELSVPSLGGGQDLPEDALSAVIAGMARVRP
jgi:L-fuculose-phosphate aldolase